MPRISRNDVVFEVDGREWIARFTHVHNEKGMQHHVGGGKLLTVKHVTSVKLSYRNQVGTFLYGQAPCGMKDKYDWQRGIKLALLRALEKGGFCKLHKHVCSGCFLDRTGHDGKFLGLLPKHSQYHKYREVEIAAEPLKETFGKIISAFYRELPIKVYYPHRPEDITPGARPERRSPAPIDGELLNRASLGGLPPVITGVSAAPEDAQYIGKMHGYGWTGD